MKRRNTMGTVRALDQSRSRKSSQAAAAGRVAGGGMGVDPSGRFESKLGEGFYQDGDKVWQLRVKPPLMLAPGSPKGLAVDARALLAASEPTPNDIKGTEPTDNNLTATLNRFEQAFQAGDAANAAAIAAILPFTAGNDALSGGTAQVVVGFDLSSGTYATFIQRRTQGSSPGSLYVDPANWTATKIQIDSTDPSDDGEFSWLVIKLT